MTTHLSKEDQDDSEWSFRNGWKERGRELNNFYDEITIAMRSCGITSRGDPLEDLKLITRVLIDSDSLNRKYRVIAFDIGDGIPEFMGEFDDANEALTASNNPSVVGASPNYERVEIQSMLYTDWTRWRLIR